MIQAADYTFKNLGTLLSHFPSRTFYVRDQAAGAQSDGDELLRLRARIHSGDYLQTLATELDDISQRVGAAGRPESVELERIVNELLVLVRQYTITKKQ